MNGPVKLHEGTSILSDGNGPRVEFLGFRTTVLTPKTEEEKAEQERIATAAKALAKIVGKRPNKNLQRF